MQAAESRSKLPNLALPHSPTNSAGESSGSSPSSSESSSGGSSEGSDGGEGVEEESPNNSSEEDGKMEYTSGIYANVLKADVQYIWWGLEFLVSVVAPQSTRNAE